MDDTIAAISTPLGVAGISVIRVSGPRAIELVDKVFQGKRRLTDCVSHTMHVGKLVNGPQGEMIDLVVAAIMRGPDSYTGLDTVEISCHGGLINTKKVLDVILATGARLAEPGEFTKIAFLNGKMDLAQIESVASLIHAKTEGARRATIAQFNGGLSAAIKDLRSSLLQVCSVMELDVDFSEEQLLNVDPARVLELIDGIGIRVRQLLGTFDTGRVIREGARVSIVGKPNVGKSSLLNALLQTDRAIVSDEPGTTRDYLEEVIDIGGIPFVLVDTAGMRSTTNKVELAGIKQAFRLVQKSDVIVCVFDISRTCEDDDVQVIRRLNEEQEQNPSCHVVYVGNKSDIGVSETWRPMGLDITPISAVTGHGIDDLKNRLTEIYMKNTAFESPMISTIRHRDALQKCVTHLDHAKEALTAGQSFEFVAVDFRAAINSLGEIIGEITNQDILDNIFSHFCIGK